MAQPHLMSRLMRMGHTHIYASDPVKACRHIVASITKNPHIGNPTSGPGVKISRCGGYNLRALTNRSGIENRLTGSDVNIEDGIIFGNFPPYQPHDFLF